MFATRKDRQSVLNEVQSFLGGMFGTRAVEIVAVLCGLANVLLIIRRSLWNYPFGLVMVTLYAWIFFNARLYSDSILQVFFFIIQLFGIVWWIRGRNCGGELMVRKLPVRQLQITAAVAVCGIAAMGGVMANWTNAALPYPDAAVMVLSVVAQMLLARRFVENWVLWIIVDVIAIGVYVAKDLHPTAALYGIFLILAIAGLLDWRRAAERQGEEA